MKIGIILPCYNEEQVLYESARILTKLLNRLISLKKITPTSRILYIDDGSNDGTWNLIKALSDKHSKVGGIKLSRNFGHQNAILAGLLTVKGDAIVSLDADLQDDVNTIEAMIDDHLKGSEIVYAVREDRSIDSRFKRISAHFFYKFMNFIGSDVVYNHADFRLLSRRAINALKEFREINIFLRGVVPLIGLKSSIVYYKRNQRAAGKTKYPLRKMINFAIDGITSFSVAPLRVITVIGFVIFSMSLIMIVYIFWVWLFSNSAVPGWASTTLPIYFLGGIQILFIGILGEYLGKTYQEIKGRPRYLIEESVNTSIKSNEINKK
ncbi:glycosyltransferase family 2 protein [bacterium]|nr:glycosyltransferase family 2 protein [bacterium]